MRNSKVQVIQVPYDSGNRGVRMGSGPEHFVSSGLAEVLQADNHEVWIETVESKARFRAEIQTQFELYGLLADRVAKAKKENKFPLVLSGNCGASLSAIAGAKANETGVIWFDAHGDFNTPETTTGGFLDGMALAIAAGLCWKRLAASIPNFSSVSGERILHVGGRDFDPEERERLLKTGVSVVDYAGFAQSNVRDALRVALSKFRWNAEEAHLHIDLDVLNPTEAPANEYATGDAGLSVAQAVEAIEFIKENLNVTSATIASFDPNFDSQQKTLQAGLRLIRTIII